jgi:hypothetical protein
MIFPDVTTEDFLSKHDELKVIEGFCDHCGTSMKTTIPFIEKGAVGLVSPKCKCGKNRNQAMIGLPTSRSEIQYWNQFLAQ